MLAPGKARHSGLRALRDVRRDETDTARISQDVGFEARYHGVHREATPSAQRFLAYTEKTKKDAQINQNSMNRWIWSVTEENWKVAKSKKLWATSRESQKNKIKRGDFIVFYVKGTGMFQGVFQVNGDWYDAQKPMWEDESGKIKYPHQCRLKEHVIGTAVFNELIPKLSFAKNRDTPYLALKGHAGGPANNGHPIDEKDFNALVNEMKRPSESERPPSQARDHEKTIDKLNEIGMSLGFETSTDRDFTSVGRGSVVDLVWYMKVGNIGTVQYVFEVQSKGSIKSLVNNLIQAIGNPLVKKVVAVSDSEQLKEIEAQVTQMKAISESTKSMFVYLDVNKVDRIYELLPEWDDFRAFIKLS